MRFPKPAIGSVRKKRGCEVAVGYHGRTAIGHNTGGKKVHIWKSIWMASSVELGKTIHTPKTVNKSSSTIITSNRASNLVHAPQPQDTASKYSILDVHRDAVLP